MAKTDDKMEVESTGKHTAGFGPFDNDKELDPKIEECYKLAKTESRQAAIDALFQLERVNRLATAAPETSCICVSIVRLVHADKDWKGIGQVVTLISKRRAQLKAAVTRSVQEAMSYLEEITDEPTKLELLKTLHEVTTGKIYVELERARLTRILSDIYEKNNDLANAAKIMQELQVETFGGMERKEKFDFILEQMRLCMLRDDFIRAAIISKKILPRQLSKDGLEEIKMRFYAHMIRIHARNSDYLDICRSYLERFETLKKSDKVPEAERELKLVCLFLVLSPRDNLQNDLLHNIRKLKEMESLTVYKDLLQLFVTQELIQWSTLKETFKDEMNAQIASAKTESMEQKIDWEETLHERVTEHNLRVVSKYYSRIKLDNLAKLLDLSVDDTERKVAALVSDKKSLWAKIDRPAQIVSFLKPKDADALLNGWAADVSSLLDIVERTCHLVHREKMVQGMKNDAPVET